MALETHFGIEVDLVRFPEETKKKIIEIRNSKIKSGEENWTCTDVLVWAVNMAHVVTTKQNEANKAADLKSKFAMKTPTLEGGKVEK